LAPRQRPLGAALVRAHQLSRGRRVREGQVGELLRRAGLRAMKATPELREAIRANLAALARHTFEIADRRRAAVAILLSPVDGVLTYALTRRAPTLRRNPGNYALPGGGLEPGEDAIDAAIREAAEELGVLMTRAQALGLLDDFITLGGHHVTPVVLW